MEKARTTQSSSHDIYLTMLKLDMTDIFTLLPRQTDL